MSHYDDILLELRQKGQILANKYIAELYNILREEEKLTPEDSRAKIEHDCIDLWSKETIRKYLPPETKDIKKQRAGKIAAEKKKREILLLSNGQEQIIDEHKDAGINPAENSSVSQEEQESITFQNELNQQLSYRTLSPELLEANKIIADVQRSKEELEKENTELRKQVYGKYGTLIIYDEIANEIYSHVAINRSAGKLTEIRIEHNGYEVIAIL